jgi:hypothetical protein
MDKPKSRTRPIKKSDNVIINDDDLFAAPKKGKSTKTIHDMFNEAVTTTTKNTSQTNQTDENAIFKKNSKPINKPKTTSKKSLNDSDKSDDEDNTFQKNGYSRPDITYTDQLSKEQIEKKLEDYKKVDDIMKVPLGVHLRYFSDVGGKLAFRMGGQLHKNTGLPDYVILSNGKTQWSVQVKNTIFYRKMVLQEIKEEYEKIILEHKEKIKKLKDEIKTLKK